MSSSTSQSSLKMKNDMGILKLDSIKLTTAIMATDPNCTAVAPRERFAAFVSFQWHQASHPLP